MKYTVFFNVTGRIFLCASNMSTQEIEATATSQGLTTIEVDDAVDPDNAYVQSGSVVPMGVRPSPTHAFNYNKKVWEDIRTFDDAWADVRTERNRRLQACDWTQLSDIPAETKALWEPYRQALRDITDQPDPFNIIWPTPPQ
jgi:hypothetical protein